MKKKIVLPKTIAQLPTIKPNVTQLKLAIMNITNPYLFLLPRKRTAANPQRVANQSIP